MASCDCIVRMKWTKVEVLGSGSYGVVSMATCFDDPSFPVIAIKSSSLENSSSLIKESRILEKLNGSPHVVMYLGDTLSFHYSLLTRTTLYDLYLEYLPGGTLSDLIRARGGYLPEHEARDYTRMILKGLSHIHEKGFVHCDLKPDNILAAPCRDGDCDDEFITYSLKIADFGLAKEPGDEKIYGRTYVYKFRGTPMYMSPESFLWGQIDSPLDIWSLGCIVVEMLTGHRAMRHWFGNDDDLSGFLFFTKQEPLIPDNICHLAQDFLRRCFDPSPTQRWTAEMLLGHPYLQSSDRFIFRQHLEEERIYKHQDELCTFMVDNLFN